MPATVESPTICLIAEEVPCWVGAITGGRAAPGGGVVRCAPDEGLPKLRACDVVLLDLEPTNHRLRELLQEVDAMPGHCRPRVMLCGSACDPALRILARTFNVPLVRREEVAVRWPLHLAPMRVAAQRHRVRQHMA